MTFGAGNLTNGGGVTPASMLCPHGINTRINICDRCGNGTDAGTVSYSGKQRWPPDPAAPNVQADATKRELATATLIASNALRELHEKCEELIAAAKRIAELEQALRSIVELSQRDVFQYRDLVAEATATAKKALGPAQASP